VRAAGGFAARAAWPGGQLSIWLGIEAATPTGGAAVTRDGVLLAEVTLGLTTRHSELLLPAIEFVLHAAGTSPAQLDGIVVGAGPGSFTGVRIAAATARGLAAALRVPLYAHSSLAAVAAGAAVLDRPVCALFDARRGEVYAGCYRFSREGFEELLAPAALPLAVVLERVRPWTPVFVGDGATRYASHLPEPGLPTLLSPPRAAALLWLQQLEPGAGLVPGVAGWEPAYLRESGQTGAARVRGRLRCGPCARLMCRRCTGSSGSPTAYRGAS
jgi:tRNA threonylcarbamoyladenosine biosynthesis protein TsaB